MTQQVEETIVAVSTGTASEDGGGRDDGRLVQLTTWSCNPSWLTAGPSVAYLRMAKGSYYYANLKIARWKCAFRFIHSV